MLVISRGMRLNIEKYVDLLVIADRHGIGVRHLVASTISLFGDPFFPGYLLDRGYFISVSYLINTWAPRGPKYCQYAD